MNTWQLCNEIKRVLNAQIWTGTTASPVFGARSAVVTVGPEIEAGTAFRLPTALIRPLNMIVDPENSQQPDLVSQRIGIRLMNQVAGDALGEAVLIGGFWVFGDQQTDGRGLLEIEEEIFNAIQLLAADSGVEIQLMAAGAAQAALIEELGYVAWRDYEFQAWLTASRDYPPATELLGVSTTTATVSLTWVNPFITRYDFRRMMLRTAAGATPPGPAGGLELTLSGDTATSHIDLTTSGLHSYSLFAVYDDREDPPVTDREFSEADTLTITVL